MREQVPSSTVSLFAHVYQVFYSKLLSRYCIAYLLAVWIHMLSAISFTLPLDETWLTRVNIRGTHVARAVGVCHRR